MISNLMNDIRKITILFLVILFLRLNTAASNFCTTNTHKSEEQTSTTSKPYAGNTILAVLSSTKTVLTNDTVNLPTSITNTIQSNNSVHELAKIQGKVVTTIRSYDYTDYTTYKTAGSNESLSGCQIAGIPIGVLILLCCCSGCGYKRKEIWELRRIA